MLCRNVAIPEHIAHSEMLHRLLSDNADVEKVPSAKFQSVSIALDTLDSHNGISVSFVEFVFVWWHMNQ